jgi:hypothetical protein
MDIWESVPCRRPHSSYQPASPQYRGSLVQTKCINCTNSNNVYINFCKFLSLTTWAVPESQHCCVQVEFWKRKNFTSWENIKISYKNKIYNHCRTKFTICSKEKINNQMQRQNWQPATKTKFTTSCKDKVYNQMQRQNLQPASKTTFTTSFKDKIYERKQALLPCMNKIF